jgi:hypothetical protein
MDSVYSKSFLFQNNYNIIINNKQLVLIEKFPETHTNNVPARRCHLQEAKTILKVPFSETRFSLNITKNLYDYNAYNHKFSYVYMLQFTSFF